MIDYHEVAPYIYVYENVINNCSEIINVAKKSIFWQDSFVISKSGDNVINKNVRICKVLPTLNENFHDEISKLMWTFGDNYGKSLDVGFSNMENPAVLHYKKNNNFYKKHSDSSKTQPRIFSSILYLNDVVSGGETVFKKHNVSIKPKAGRLVFFPSNYAYEHQANPPISEDKFVIVCWFVP